MSKEVAKLKEALNSLSQLSYATSSSKRQSQQLEALQQQLAVSGRVSAAWLGVWGDRRHTRGSGEPAGRRPA